MLKAIYTILTNKLFYLFMGITLLVPYIYSNLPIRIDFTQQESLENKVWVTYDDLNVQSEYILFIPPKSKYIQNDNIKYLKKIACSENQKLEVDGTYYFCDNKLIGKANVVDMNGNKLKRFIFNGVVPKGKFFVVGTHPFSYDSKYFGFIDKEKVLRKAKPLFEEKEIKL